MLKSRVLAVPQKRLVGGLLRDYTDKIACGRASMPTAIFDWFCYPLGDGFLGDFSPTIDGCSIDNFSIQERGTGIVHLEADISSRASRLRADYLVTLQEWSI